MWQYSLEIEQDSEVWKRLLRASGNGAGGVHKQELPKSVGI